MKLFKSKSERAYYKLCKKCLSESDKLAPEVFEAHKFHCVVKIDDYHRFVLEKLTSLNGVDHSNCRVNGYNLNRDVPVVIGYSYAE
jgi:hypothetical protein